MYLIVSCNRTNDSLIKPVDPSSDAKQEKHAFFLNHHPKKLFFLVFCIIIYNIKAGKCFIILWSAYSCYIQVVKHYIPYVNCIFMDSEINY